MFVFLSTWLLTSITWQATLLSPEFIKPSPQLRSGQCQAIQMLEGTDVDVSGGSSWWTRPSIDGAGIWVTCVRGKEKQTVGELYDLFEALAEEIWPDSGDDDANGAAADGEEDMSIESQIAKEVAMLKRPRKLQRFVVFISCKPPIDPVKLVRTHVANVLRTGITHTRYTHRLVPSSGTAQATIPEIHSLCRRVLPPFFDRDPIRKCRYKVELTVRNHTTLPRMTIIQEVARCVPEGHIVDLENPEVFILVQIFKNVCGMSVVEDYYKLQKFNVMEIANAKNEARDLP